MSSSTLPLEIAENGLTHCYYLSLHCSKCGDFRIGTDQEAADLYACPLCQRLSGTVPLGQGGTLRPLPFWDRTEGKGAYREMLGRMLGQRKRRMSPSSCAAGPANCGFGSVINDDR